eukprot:12932859-Prorocentrum_lima.AAC.1
MGKKHVTQKRPNTIAPGNDDCGEDASPISQVDTIDRPFDFGAPAYLTQEHSLELRNFHPTYEAYLTQCKAEVGR